MPDSNQSPRIGLLAAWGRFPFAVAEALKRDGHQVFCLGVRGHCDPAIAKVCDHFGWVGAAQTGRAIRYFRRHGCRDATMAGKFHKVTIYDPLAWLRYIPDLTFLRTFSPHFFGRKADRRDDTLLGALVGAFAKGGVRFLPATDFAPELLVNEGHIAGKPITVAQQADIQFGWDIAKQMGGLDIGQSISVKDRAVIAVEAIEGTDAAIRRAGELCRKGGFTVVKVAKPNQDMRFDVPTVGVGTLRTMAEAGGKVLAIEADKTILLDDAEFRTQAERLGIRVVAIANKKMAKAAA